MFLTELASPKNDLKYSCPLCLSQTAVPFCLRRDGGRDPALYLKCPECFLIFLFPESRLSLEEEKRRYDSHQNDARDSRYLAFLERLAGPLSTQLRTGARGLDFGCGPGPAMSLIFRSKGFLMDDYDPIYQPNAALLESGYDFITASEVIEHFYHPRREFELLDRLLKRGGFLGIMTGVLSADEEFRDWWYPRDPTHVSFYQKETLRWIARWQGWDLELPEKNIAIFRKYSVQ